MNALEFAAAMVVVAVGVAIGYFQYRRWNTFGVLLLIVAALFGAARVSQFATVDEFGIGVGAVTDSAGFLDQWQQGPLHTTGAVFIPVGKILSLIVPDFTSVDVGLPIFKVLHWLVSTLLLIVLALQAAKLVGDGDKTGRNFFLLTTVVLVLPVSLLAIKTFNYDAIALIGAVLACLLMVRAYRERVARLGRVAVVVAALAAQEKLNASPILLLCLYCNGLLVADLRQRTAWHDALKTLVLDTLIVLLVGSVSAIAYGSTTSQPLLPGFFLDAIVNPLVIWAYVPFAFLFDKPEVFWRLRVPLVPAIVIAIGIAQVFTLRIRGHVAVQWLTWARTDRVALRVLLIALCASLVGALIVEPKWAPHAPSDIAALDSSHLLNGVFLHFGMRTMLQHYAAFLLYACAVCFVSLPFVFWLAALASATRFREATPVLPPGLSALLWLAYALVLLAVAMAVPLNSKYLSISIFIVAVVVAIRVLQIAAPISSRAWNLGALCTVATLLLELAPFAPLYASFRPFWLEYGDVEPRPGVINASWVGWGEETMLAGLVVQRACALNEGKFDGTPCNEIRLHSGYFGMWLGSHEITQDVSLDRRFDSSADYFVINRSLFVQSPASLKPIIPPVFTIDARGYPMAWVYRGDQLAASGWFSR